MDKSRVKLMLKKRRHPVVSEKAQETSAVLPKCLTRGHRDLGLKCLDAKCYRQARSQGGRSDRTTRPPGTKRSLFC